LNDNAFQHQPRENMRNNIDLLNELDAGICADKISAAIKDIGLAAVHTGKTGKLTIELSFKRYGNTRQCEIAHKIKTDEPTETGKRSEEDTKTTPVFVHTDGVVSIFAEDQKDLFKIGEYE